MARSVSMETARKMTDTLNGISKEHRRRAFDALMRLDLEHPGAADFDAAVRVVAGFSERAIQDTNFATTRFYNGIRFRQLGEESTKIAQVQLNREANERAVRGILAEFSQAGETKEKIAEHLAWRVDYEVKASSGEALNQLANAESRTLKRKVRFQRVTFGDSCEFCEMLASRGAVYHTARLAGKNTDHYHADCDCRIVPMFVDGAEVAGYDYKAVYDHWRSVQLAKRYNVRAVGESGLRDADLRTVTEDGRSVYRDTDELLQLTKEAMASSEYAWMLDSDYESLLYGFNSTHDDMKKKRAYQTAMAIVQPDWRKSR